MFFSPMIDTQSREMRADRNDRISLAALVCDRKKKKRIFI